MFEVIGIVVVGWIVFSIIKGIFRGRSIARSQEYGKEAKHIATKDLGVPPNYYRYMVLNNMDAVRNTANHLPQHDSAFKRTSWPRRLALTIYGDFRQDCEQWHAGNPVTHDLFQDLGIHSDEINTELSRNAENVIYSNA